MRKNPLITGELYHIFNKSIAGYTIYNNAEEFLRMFNVICYYQREGHKVNFSKFFRSGEDKKVNCVESAVLKDKRKLVEIISYCLMPTHFHLILKQIMDDGISTFLNNIENSYSRYFNLKHKRKGPLWEGRFKSVLIKTDEQLLHLTRYIHLNPVTAQLVNEPEKWSMSSYNEYLSVADENNRICNYNNILHTEPTTYRRFVEDRISYQRELAKIKELMLEENNLSDRVGRTGEF